MPLVHGASHIKWHLPHSIHSDHRGRTNKCPVGNHRIEYNYTKIIPVRIAIDKNNALSECLIEFEIIQEFPSNGHSVTHHAGGTGPAGGPGAGAAGAAGASSSAPATTGSGGSSSRDERITLGRLTLNLAEYVEESEAIMRDIRPTTRQTSSNIRASLDKSSDNIPHQPSSPDPHVQEGIIRRYLLTDAKVNSTLKISLLVIQLDGERAYTVPPLKTAGAVFGGGILGGGGGGRGNADEFAQHASLPEQDAANLSAAFNPDRGGAGDAAGGGNNSSSRDAAAARHEAQDVYRRALAASWACQPGELPADECIEDIFSGGDGFGEEGPGGIGGDVTPRGGGSVVGGSGGGASSNHHHHHRHGSQPHSKGMTLHRQDSGSSSTGDANDFLRPGTASGLKRNGTGGGSGRRMRAHVRHGSGESGSTLRHNDGGARPGSSSGASVVGGLPQRSGGHHRDGSKDSTLQRGGVLAADGGIGMRRSSLASLSSLAGSTMESERGRGAFKSASEVTEGEVREDFVAWKLPGTV